MKPALDIVIVNWNGGELLQSCLRSIAETRGDGYQIKSVILVDNGSEDGSIDRINVDLPLRVIRNGRNLGFAAASNAGAGTGSSPYILFLNPDTRLFRDSIETPMEFMEKEPGVGICGIQMIDESGRVSRSCARFPSAKTFAWRLLGLDRISPVFPSVFLTDWDHAESREVDHVIGAFYLVRRELFERLEGFDAKSFFVYLEDLDFSLRARREGFKSFYLATAQAFHKGGGTSERIRARRIFFSIRSRIRYGFKHFSYAQAMALALATLLIEPLPRLLQAVLNLSVSQVVETAVAWTLLWRSFPTILGRPERPARKIRGQTGT